jgi:hypothetical protein
VSSDPSTTGTTTGSVRPRARAVRRGPVLLVVIAAIVVAVVAQQRAPDDQVASISTAARAASGVPAPDVASSAWYCAAGTSSRDGGADETVVISSLAHEEISATVTVMPGGDAPPATDRLRLDAGEQVSVRVADILATADPGVVVETAGGPAVVSHVLARGGDVASEPCTRRAAADWYFASGTTVEGSQHDLVLFNPFGDDAIVDVSFATDTGAQEPTTLQALVVPRRSRVRLPVQDSVLRQARVATHVHARTGRIIAEQVEVFDRVTLEDGETRDGIALSLGAVTPATTWRIPAGSTVDGGSATLSLANFTDTDVQVEVIAVFEGSPKKAEPQLVRVPAQGVADVGVTTRVPRDTAYTVLADARTVDGRRVPVVAELAATWSPASASSGLASVVGTPLTATRWVVTRPDVDADAVATVFNPGPDPVTVALLPADLVDRARGAASEPEVAVPPGEMRTLRLALLGTRRSAAVLTAEQPIVVGLTALGRAGASISLGVPDFSHGGSGS